MQLINGKSSVTIDSNIADIVKKFKLTGKSLKNYKKWFENDVADKIIYPKMEKIFDVGGIPKWESKKENAFKNKWYPGSKMEDLKKSFTDKHHKDAVFEVSEKELKIGSKVKTEGGLHSIPVLFQTGTKNMPKREIFSKEVLLDLQRNIMGSLKKHVNKILKDNFQKNKGGYGGERIGL